MAMVSINRTSATETNYSADDINQNGGEVVAYQHNRICDAPTSVQKLTFFVTFIQLYDVLFFRPLSFTLLVWVVLSFFLFNYTGEEG